MIEYWKCVWRNKGTISGRDFTEGKIYPRVNGVMEDNSGFTWTNFPNNLNNARFVQVDGLSEQPIEYVDDIGGRHLLTIKSDENKTHITYKSEDKIVTKVINREISEDEMMTIVDGLTKRKLVDKETTKFDYGTIGTKTNITDSLGVELYVGDVVQIYHNGEKRCEAFVVEDDGTFFVMGIRSQVSNNWGFKIQKVKSYKDLENDEQYGTTKVANQEEE